jgi:hypothetical protein
MLGALKMVLGRLLAGCITACLCMAAAAQDGTYYKWTDASGTVHFSATPPPGNKAQALKLEGQGEAQATPAPQPPPSSEPTAELQKAQEAYRMRSCEAARNDLKVLEQDRMVVQGDNPNAATKLDAEQRAQAKLRARQRVSQYCGAGAKP